MAWRFQMISKPLAIGLRERKGESVSYLGPDVDGVRQHLLLGDDLAILEIRSLSAWIGHLALLVQLDDGARVDVLLRPLVPRVVGVEAPLEFADALVDVEGEGGGGWGGSGWQGSTPRR